MTESTVRKEDTMEKIRVLAKAQLAQSEFDIRSYHFITETGTFTAYLDLKVWGKRCLECFFTFADGRKIVACTFPEADYLGLADIPIGTNRSLTFEETVRSKRIYLRRLRLSCSVTSRELVCRKFHVFGENPNPPNKNDIRS